MVKISISILLIISVFLNLILWNYNKSIEKEIKICYALAGERSVVYTFALDNKRYNSMRKMLTSDILQIVYYYDKNLFSESKVLSSICKDWQSIIKPIVEKEIKSKKSLKINLNYWKKVQKNYLIIEKDCRIRSNEN